MTEIRAVVRSLEGEFAWVEVEHGGCGRCHEPGGCGGQHLTQAFCSSPKRYRVPNTSGVMVGEQVTIGIPEGAVRHSANLAYVLPIVCILVGAILGMRIAEDSGAMVGGLLGLIAAWMWIRFSTRRGTGNVEFQPHIISPSSTHR